MKKSFLFLLIGILTIGLSYSQTMTTVAGTGVAGYSGDGGQADSATTNFPVKVACDASGNIYFADDGNNAIRRIDASTGIITTIAGNGTAGYTGDGGPASSATINGPWGVALDPAGNIYFSDVGNNVVRRIDAETGIISTAFGNGTPGYSGDGGPALSASFNGVTGLAIDQQGNFFVTDDNNNVVRRIDGATGIVTTIAGNGTYGYSGDGGPATSASLAFPVGISVDGNGNIYLADSDNNRIRKINNSGVINTIAGTGNFGYNGDGILATSANLANPWDVIPDANGNLYIADFYNCKIRRVDASTGLISTYAGTTCGYSDGPLATAQINAPIGLCFDNGGNLIIMDAYSNRIRKVAVANAPPPTVILSDADYIGAGPDLYMYSGQSGAFFARGGTAYHWSPNQGLSDVHAADPVVTVTATTTYIVKITTSPGNFVYDTVVFYVLPPPSPQTAASCGNWVQNGDFDDASGYACSNPADGMSKLANGWGNGAATTADRYSSCYGNNGQCCVPINCMSGGGPGAVYSANMSNVPNGYGGLILYSDNYAQFGSYWQEYYQQNLTCPLVSGQSYSYGFKADLARRGNFDCGDVSMLLSTTKPTGTNYLTGNPQIGGNIGNTWGWQSFSGSIVGAGQQWITLGNFGPQGTSGCPRLATNSYCGTTANVDQSYVFIDEVYIKPTTPTIKVAPNTHTVCAGFGPPTTFTLTELGSPGPLCTWTDQNGTVIVQGSNTATVSPTAVGTYTYYCTVNLGCSFCPTLVATTTITVKPYSPGSTLTTSVTPTTMCAGSIAQIDVLGGLGGSAYVWSPNGSNSYIINHTGSWNTIYVQPTTAGVYTYSVTTSQCQNTGVATVTVYNPTVTVNSATICSGHSVTLNAAGASSYSWSPGTGLSSTTGSSVTASPTVTTHYTVTGTDSHGCSNTAVATVSVSTTPNLNVNYTPNSPCVGQTVTVTISGPYTSFTVTPGNTYTVSSSPLTYTLVVNSTSTTYTAIGMNSNGCQSNPKVFTINAKPLPVVTLSVSPNPLCPPSSVTLTATGGANNSSSYTWSSNMGTSSHNGTIVLNPGPTVSTTYSVTATGITGCTNTASVTVTVSQPPNFSVGPVTSTVCTGAQINFAAIPLPFNSPMTFSWTPGFFLSCTNCPNPSAMYNSAGSFTYNVTATGPNGCKTTKQVMVKVIQSPILTASGGSMCSGNTTTVTASGAGNNSTYTISPSAINQTVNGAGNASFTVNPSSTTVFTVSGTNSIGCTGTKTVSVIVNPTPTITVSNPTVCIGSNATVTATGASSYTFMPGAITNTTGIFSVNGPINVPKTYTVTGANGGCKSSVTGTITPVQTPTVSITVATQTVNGCSTVASSNTICAGNTANLTASGANSYTWNPGGLTGSTIAVTPTVTTTYTVTGAVGSCASTNTVTITVSSCTCTGSPIPAPHGGGATNLPPGTYALNGNLVLPSTSTLTCGSGVDILIAPSVTLTVQQNAVLNIAGAHLHSCTDMWHGISVNQGGTINVTGNALIEDAIVAIDNNPSNATQSGTPAKIIVNGGVFNCNRTAIREAHYEDVSNGAPGQFYSTNYFSVDNAVITCRCGIPYPVTMSNLNTYTGGTVTNPTIHDIYNVATNYSAGNLKNPYNGLAPYEGIKFDDACPITPTPTTTPVNYLYQVGGSGLVLFDNLVYGINAINTNIKVVNSAFQAPRQAPQGILGLLLEGGYGINAVNITLEKFNGLYVSNSSFMDLVRGVHNTKYYEIDINNNTLFSKQSIVPAGTGLLVPPHGDYGMFVKSPHFRKASFNQNKIANIKNAIDFVIDVGLGQPGQNGETVGPVTVTNNTLSAQFSNSVAHTNPYIGQGIVVDNVLATPTTGSVVGAGTTISVSNNTITESLRGILIRNQQWQEVRDENNTVTMIHEPTNFTTQSTQYGIAHDHVIYPANGAFGDDIYNNTVTGPYSSFSNGSSFYEPKKGIWCRFTANHYVTCNSIDKQGREMEFEGLNQNTFWRLNTMNRYLEGYVLSNSGIIGQQGTSSNGTDNNWTNGLGLETLTDGSSAPSSVLYINGSFPPNNATLGGTKYIPSISLLNATGPSNNPGPDAYDCSILPPTIAINPNATSGNYTARSGNNSVASTSQDISFMEEIVTDSVNYASYPTQSGFINKNLVYHMLGQDSSLMDSSMILQNFYQTASNGCIGTYCLIEDSLRSQNYSYVSALMNTLVPSCTIEQNYQRFYQIYLNAVQETSTSSDSADLETLAASCPMINGMVVLQARSFHNSWYNEFKHYEDNCPQNTGVGNRSDAAGSQVSGEKFALNFYPNPTTGIVNVAGSDGTDRAYKAEIYDVSGRLIFKEDLILEKGLGKFKLDAQNGVYMLYLYGNESKGASIYRIMINK